MTVPWFMEEIDERGVARLTLTRADEHNRLSAQLILELSAALNGLAHDERVRVLVLAARGTTFCAGADLQEMLFSGKGDRKENLDDARAFSELMHDLSVFPKPVVGVVQGNVYGGGLGLVACCDIAVCAEGVSFQLSEVRLGLIPAVIAPYVINRIGPGHFRCKALLGEAFDAREAFGLGLVHKLVPYEDLRSATGRVLESLLRGGPQAQTRIKQLNENLSSAETARLLADIRTSGEAQEGMQAFRDRQEPDWS